MSFRDGIIFKISSPHTEKIYIGCSSLPLNRAVSGLRASAKFRKLSCNILFQAGDIQSEVLEKFQDTTFVRPALFVLTHFSRYCVCIVPSFFRISGTVMSWNFSNTSLWISPAWKRMLHESFRNFALARSPETARFSGRLEHPMYILSVLGDDILKIMPSRKLIISFKLWREKNIFVKFVFLCVLLKVEKFATEDRHRNVLSFQSYHTADWKPNQSIFKPSYQNHTKITQS